MLQIKYGDTIPADGIVMQSNDLRVDENALTGENNYVLKSTEEPVVLSGKLSCKVINCKIKTRQKIIENYYLGNRHKCDGWKCKIFSNSCRNKFTFRTNNGTFRSFRYVLYHYLKYKK